MSGAAKGAYDWFFNGVLIGICAVSMALWSRWTAVLAVVVLTVCMAVSDRLVYWQRRKIETMEARNG